MEPAFARNDEQVIACLFHMFHMIERAGFVSPHRSTPRGWPLVDAIGLASNVCLATTHAC